MALFQVHPHWGYLNSDIRIINGRDEQLVLKDTTDGKDYVIPAASSIAVRLTAGEHRFTAVGQESTVETVVIEDAIKLGGSREKKSYVFEGTPWILMVMLDRTYLFNRDTKEQYLEHGIAPDNIKFLNQDYLLFITEKDNSIFSLNNLSIEKTLGDVSFLYSNDHYAVFCSGNNIILYSLDGTPGDHQISLDCDDYALDETEQKLYYHIRGKKRDVSVKKLDNTTDKPLTVSLNGPFICFVGHHSTVYGSSPQVLNIHNNSTNTEAILYNAPIPVSSINGKSIWLNDAAEALLTNTVNNSFTACAELTVHERGNRWFMTEKSTYSLKNQGKISRIESYCLRFSNDKKTYLESRLPLTIKNGKQLDCVNKTSGEGILIFDDAIKDFFGTPIVSPCGYILISKTFSDSSRTLEDPLNPAYKHSYNESQEEDLYKKIGMIKERRTDETDDGERFHFHDIERGRLYAGDYYDELNIQGYFRLFGKGGDYIHSLCGHVRRMPSIKDRLIAVSEECNYSIVRSEDGIKVLEYNTREKTWIGTALERMDIDDSFYSKAVFCADGENIIYQKKGNEYYLRRLGSDEETRFELQGTVIRRNFNGYIPYMNIDSHRRPVYVDPVSLTRIDYPAAGQFTFQSIDGSIQHIAHNDVKYYSFEKNCYVAEEEYKRYVEEFDYDTFSPACVKINDSQYDTKKKKREAFFRDNEHWMRQRLRDSASVEETFFFPIGGDIALYERYLKKMSICDEVLFRKDYYVKENVNGEIVEILLPERLRYLNYISYSYDNRYIIISGKFPEDSGHSGLALVYDLIERKEVYKKTSTKAVWLGAFSKTGMVAYYDSTPLSFVSDDAAHQTAYQMILGRSFLSFSPSGKYIALSCQGYIPYSSGNLNWGHQPSRDVYIVKSDAPQKEIAHYFDHGEEIEGSSVKDRDRSNLSVASATFSVDDKKLMTVSKDGVVVVRNLHLEDAETD